MSIKQPTVADLRQELENRGLATTGTKGVLMTRLQEAKAVEFAAAPQAPEIPAGFLVTESARLAKITLGELATPLGQLRASVSNGSDDQIIIVSRPY